MENLESCPICKNREITKMFSSSDLSDPSNSEIFSYSECNNCKIIFLSTRPNESEIGKYYQNNYQPYNTNYNFVSKIFIKLRTIAEIKRFKKYNKNIKNVLEIGCSYGEYLYDLKKYGKFDVLGIELDKNTCEKGKEKFNIDIRNGRLEDLNLENNSFDLIVMNHVIEHLFNPDETLKCAYSLLRPEGLLIIKTPNFDTIEKSLFKKSWAAYEVPRHLYIFNSNTLTNLLSQVGFHVKNIKFEKTPNNIILSINNYLSEKKFKSSIKKFFNINNYFLLIIFTPLSVLLGLLKQSGRIAVIAKKNEKIL